MKNLIFIYALYLLQAPVANAQQFSKNPFNDAYRSYIKLAESHYEKKEYRLAADDYAKAFAANHGSALLNDRLKHAGSRAMSGQKDSAFMELSMLENARYTKYNALRLNADFIPLHTDPRWKEITDMVKANRAKYNINLDKNLTATLDTMLEEDQKYRNLIVETESKYGSGSKQLKELHKMIRKTDSVNVVRAVFILENKGWPSSALIGDEGSTALFLVIQHADVKTQETYVKLIEEAAKQGQIPRSYLPLLEDRIALSHGKKQIYGTQVIKNKKGGYELEPLDDPGNVDNRRKEAGLGPLSDYLKEWNIQWPEN